MQDYPNSVNFVKIPKLIHVYCIVPLATSIALIFSVVACLFYVNVLLTVLNSFHNLAIFATIQLCNMRNL
jgi:hypothetical protein